MTMPDPRGRLHTNVSNIYHTASQSSHIVVLHPVVAPPNTHKSRPTMFSSTELFPLDWLPTTTIWGRSIGLLTLMVTKTSWSLLTSLGS